MCRHATDRAFRRRSPTTLEVSSSRHTTMEWALFSEVPQDTVRAVLTIAGQRTFARGEVVFHRGDPGNAPHLISSGRFAVRITTPPGDTATLAVRGRGTRSASPSSRTSMSGPRPSGARGRRTRSVLREDFERLRHGPSVDAILVAILGERVRRLSERFTEAYYLSLTSAWSGGSRSWPSSTTGRFPFRRRRWPSWPAPPGPRSTASFGISNGRGSIALGRARHRGREVDRLRSKPI